MTQAQRKPSLRMIVADDAPFIREIVRHLVQKAAIELVGEAANGEEAVELARRHRPDLILMDIIMPQMNGIEATKQILSYLPDVRIIAFSTADQDTMVLRALEAGCCNFLVKPFKGEQLLAAIEKSLRSGADRGAAQQGARRG